MLLKRQPKSALPISEMFSAQVGNSRRGVPSPFEARFRLRAPRFGGLKPAEARGASVGGSLAPQGDGMSQR